MQRLTASIPMVVSIANVKLDMKVRVPIAGTSMNVRKDSTTAAQIAPVSTMQVTSLVSAMMDTRVMV